MIITNAHTRGENSNIREDLWKKWGNFFLPDTHFIRITIRFDIEKYLSANMWIVVKHIDFFWCSKITSYDCQNFWKHYSFVTGKRLRSVLQTTTMSETAIKILNLVLWDHRFELSMCCEIFFFWLRRCTI